MNDTQSIDERIEANRAATEQFRANLAEMGYDGPHKVEGGGLFGGAMLGGDSLVYAICLTCGAMVKVNDAIEREGFEGLWERGLALHNEWHASLS